MLFFQVIVGYLLAGSLVGPGGLNFISEMVQVTQSLAAYKMQFCPPFFLLSSIFWSKIFLLQFHLSIFSVKYAHQRVGVDIWKNIFYVRKAYN